MSVYNMQNGETKTKVQIHEYRLTQLENRLKRVEYITWIILLTLTANGFLTIKEGTNVFSFFINFIFHS